MFCVGVQLVSGNVCVNTFVFVVVLSYCFYLLLLFVCWERLRSFILWLNSICLCGVGNVFVLLLFRLVVRFYFSFGSVSLLYVFIGWFLGGYLKFFVWRERCWERFKVKQGG